MCPKWLEKGKGRKRKASVDVNSTVRSVALSFREVLLCRSTGYAIPFLLSFPMKLRVWSADRYADIKLVSWFINRLDVVVCFDFSNREYNQYN